MIKLFDLYLEGERLRDIFLRREPDLERDLRLLDLRLKGENKIGKKYLVLVFVVQNYLTTTSKLPQLFRHQRAIT